MTEVLRSSLAVVLSAALLITAPGFDRCFLWAGPQAESAGAALVQDLVKDGVLKGPDDPLRAYVVDSGELTALGLILADYHRLKKNRVQADPQFYTDSGVFGETDKALKEAFEEIRKSSKPSTGLAEKQKAVKDLSERLGKMGLVSGEDAHKLSSQIMAVLTGVRQSAGQGEVLDVYYRGDTARYYDSKGKLYGIVDKSGNIIRSREIEERQKAFNKARNSLAAANEVVPVLQESGVLDVPTLLSPYYEFRVQITQLDVSFRYDRTYSLAEILHKDKNYKPDQFLPANQEKEKKDGKTLEQQFEEERAGGSRFKAKELLDPLFTERQAYLKKAEQALKAFRAEAEALKGKDSIPESRIKALELKQREVGRLVTLAYLVGEEYHLKHAKVKLTSKEMQESLDRSAKDKEARRLYETQRVRLGARMDAVASQLLKIKANLDAMVLEGEPGEAHIAAALKNLEALSFVLSSAQGQLQGVMGDFNAYATVAGLYGTSKDIADSGWAANLVDWLGVTSQERRDRKQSIREGAKGLETAYNDIIAGNYDAARDKLEALVPNAIRDHRNVSLMTGSAEPTKAERMNASLQAFQQKLGTQAKQDFWINLGGNLLVGAAATAVLGPAAQYAALQIAKGAKTAATAIEGIQALGALGRGVAAVARGVGHMAEHTAGLLNNLNSKKWVPKGFSGAPVATRFFNAMRMEAAVSANLGLISGGLSAWQQGRDPNSPYRDKGEAFAEGFKGGAAFMIERPYLLYVGLPTTVFGRGNAVTRVLSNYGESGLVGGTSRTLTQFAKADVDVVAKAAGLFGKGAIAQSGAFMISMADQVAKYYAGAEAMGWAAKKTTYYGSKAVDDTLGFFGLVKRPAEDAIAQARARIDRAETAGLLAMQWGWLLIPTYSSAGLGPQRDQILAEHGFAERQAAGELHTMVGAEGRWMTVKSLPRPSLFSVIFGRHMEGTVGEQARFKVTREQDVAATREVIGRNAKSLPELYKLTLLGDGEVFGALKPRELWKNPGQPEYLWSIKGSEKVRDQVQILFEDMALRRPEAAGELMRTADALMRQEIARIYLQTHGEGGFFKGLFNTSKTLLAAQSGVKGGFWSRVVEGAQALTPGSKSRAAAREIVAQGREVLKAHLETEAAVNAKAEAYNKLAREVSKKTTPEFEAAVQDLVLRTDKWLKSGKKGQPPAAFEQKVLETWRSEKQADSRLSAQQKATVNALADYVVTLQERFQKAEILNAKGTRIQGLRPKQMAVLVEFLSQLAIAGPERHFRGLGETAGRLLAARSQKPTQETEAAVGKLTQDLRDWSVSKRQSAKEYAKILDAFSSSADSNAELSAPQKAALKELGRDLKNDYTVFTKTPADVVRQYLLLSTGGGKTLLAFEGILPLAKADAGSKRSLWGVGPGKKLIYITTQSNLVAQARIDYKAFKKILTKLEIMTAEEFKTRVAKGRFMGGDRPEDFWILGDELDAMALQPALTIGSETARLANENAAYRGLKNLPRQLESVLGRVEEPVLPGAGRKAANWMNLILGRSEDPVVKAASDLNALKAEHRALMRQATLRHTGEVGRLEAGLKDLKSGATNRADLEAALVRAKAKQAEAGQSAKRLETIFDGMAQTAQLPAAERPARLGELRGEYRRLLEAAVEPANPVYEVFREMKAEVSRWMESPLRRSETARMEALARIETLGAELGAKLSSKPDAKTLREVKRLVAEHRRLVETAGVKDRGAADAFEPLFKKMLEAAQGGRLDEVKALVQTHKELSQRSLTRSSWEAQFEKALDAMTRKYAGRLEKALWGESFWSGLNELYFKESRTDAGEKFRLLAEMSASRRSGKGWVRQELLNLANGFKDDPATVRFDSQDGRVHIIHNGEWFENMDTPTRRWWELHYDTDLTLPYEHQSISTVKDIITNTRVNYVAFSGTLPEQLGPHLKATSIRGVATSPENPAPRSFQGRTDMFVQAKRRVEAALKSPDKQVWIGFSNTKDLKIFKHLLERSGVPKESVAQIFSDAEFLRTLRPDANVARQMNLPGPGSAKVSVFLVDMRVGGRGLDIAFKEYGKAQGWKKGAYKDFEMIILNPQDIAFVHDVQFQGRMSPDRVLGSGPGEPMAKRSYSYFIDLAAARDNPTLRKLAKEQGRTIDAQFVIDNLKQAQAEVQLKQLRSSSVLQDQNSWRTGLKGLLDD